MIDCTIITVCWNAGDSIEKTIKSVLKQKIDFKKIEYLFVDGLSSDNTIEIIEKYQKEHKNINIRYISEKDKGLYDAMNKGANLANGKWCIYLNAGDVFFNEDSLANLLNVKNKDEYDIIYGDTVQNYEDKYRIVKSKDSDELTYLHGMEFCHQSCIIKKTFQCKNPYPLNYKIAGDCAFFTSSFVNGAKFYHVDKIISIFGLDGLSSSKGSLCIKENAEVKLKYNLITKKEYKKETRVAILKIKLREFIPKKIIKKRHDAIFAKNVKNWYSYEEIINIVNKQN